MEIYYLLEALVLRTSWFSRTVDCFDSEWTLRLSRVFPEDLFSCVFVFSLISALYDGCRK